MKKRFTEEQIVNVLREAELEGAVIRNNCRKHNITDQTFCRWRTQYGGMTCLMRGGSKTWRPRNARLKRIVAEQVLAIEGLKEIAEKNDNPDGAARSSWGAASPWIVGPS